MPPIRSKNFGNIILCNDVLQEINNKLIIIGVYSGDIIVSEFPARLRLAIYAEYYPDNDGDYNLKIEIKYSRMKYGILEVSIADAKAGAPHSIIIPNLEMSFPKGGDLRLSISINGAKSSPFLRKTIRHGEVRQLARRSLALKDI